MTIRNITKVYIRRYSDSGQTTSYVEWVDHRGRPGRTEGDDHNPHMRALIARANREFVPVEYENW
mgnify:FL=1